MAIEIERLVIGASLDVAGLTRGLQQGTAEIERFVRTASVATPLTVDVRVPGVQQAAQQTRAVTAAVTELDRALPPLSASITQAATANERLIAGMSQAGRAAAQAATDTAKIGAAATGTVKGFDQVRSGAAQMAVQLTGANAAVGQLTQGLLLMSGGGGAALAAAAAIGIVAGAMRFLERDTRKTREAVDSLLERLEGAASARLPEFDQLSREIEEAEERAGELAERIAEIRRLAAAQGAGGLKLFGPELEKDIDRLDRLREQIQGLKQARDELESSGDKLLRDLELEVRSFGLSETAARKLALEYRTDLDPATRTVAGAFLDTLDGLQQQRDALQETTRSARQTAAAIVDVFEEAARVVQQAVSSLPVDPFGKLVQKQQAGRPDALGLIALPDTGIDAGFERAQQAAGDLNEELLAAASASNAFFRQAAREAEDTRSAVQKLSDEIHEITAGLDSIVGAAVNIGAIGEEAARAIGQVQDLADAVGNLRDIAGNITTGGLLGLVGAGINLIGGLLGGGESEHDRIIRENTEAIQRNTAERSTAFQGVAGDQRIASSIDQVFAQRGARVEAGLDVGTMIEQFDALGVSVADLERIAAEFDLDIVNDKGKLVGDALQQLRKEILDSIKVQLQFNDTLADQQLEADLRARIAGEPQDAAATFERNLDVISDFSPAIASAFEGVDLSNAEATRSALTGLLDQFDTGVFAQQPELFGDLTREDFFEFLGQGADALDVFNQGVQDAGKQLGNIPEFFNLGAAEALVRERGAVTGAAVGLAPVEGPQVSALTPEGAIGQLSTPLLEEIAGKTPDDLLDRLDLIAELLGGSTDQIKGAVRGTDGAALPLTQFLGQPEASTIGEEVFRGVVRKRPQEPGTFDAPLAGEERASVIVQWSGNVVIQGAEKSGDELGQEIAEYFERQADASFGGGAGPRLPGR